MEDESGHMSLGEGWCRSAGREGGRRNIASTMHEGGRVMGAREEGRLKDEHLMKEGRRKGERRTLKVQRERTGSKVEGGLSKDGGSKKHVRK